MHLSDKCFICKKPLNSKSKNEIAKVTRGLKTLQDVSKERKDGNEHFLKRLKSINIHVKCRMKYVNKQRGRFTYNDFKDGVKPTTGPVNDSLTRRDNFLVPKVRLTNLKRPSTAFDFQTNCFLCAEEASQNVNKKNLLKSAQKIHFVNDLFFKENLLGRIEKSQDSWGKQIKSRIAAEDLIGKKAKYHSDCLKKYFSICDERENREKKEKPVNLRTSEYMKKIYEFIDRSDEYHFLLSDLTAAVDIDCVPPSAETIKKKLQERYEDRVHFYSKKGGITMVFFDDVEYSSLRKKWLKKNRDVEEEEKKILRHAAAVLRQRIRAQESVSEFYSFCD